MISGNSPDVWARQDEFRFDATIGVPPDAFSETGQDWGLPPWRWPTSWRDTDFAWMRARARRYGDLYDGYRIDHLVGLYRTYVRPIDKAHAGVLRSRRGRRAADRARRNADRHLRRRRARAGGDRRRPRASIPPFVRESMTRLDLPGLKVLRWERHWDRPTAAADRPGGPIPSDRSRRPARTTSSRWRRRPKAQTEEHAQAILQSLLSAGSCLTLIPAAGRLRLDRSHQHAGGGGRRELDLARAVARRRRGSIASETVARADQLKRPGRGGRTMSEPTRPNSPHRTDSRPATRRRHDWLNVAAPITMAAAARQGRDPRLLDLRLRQLHARAARSQDARAAIPATSSWSSACTRRSSPTRRTPRT